MIRISAIYENVPGSHFDGAYYVGTHTAFATGLLAHHGLHSIRVTLGNEGLDGSPPAFWAISEMVFNSRTAFDEGMADCGAKLFADSVNYTNVSPVLQLSTLSEQ